LPLPMLRRLFPYVLELADSSSAPPRE
jgi:hypothetical protein